MISFTIDRADIPATATEAETASAAAAISRANATTAAAAVAANNGTDAVEGELNMHVDNVGTGMGVGVVNGVHDAAIQEARQLINAIQDQNRGGGGGIGGGVNPTISNDAKDDKDSLPCFFVVTASPSIEIRSAPSNSSTLIRTIKKVRNIYIVSYDLI